MAAAVEVPRQPLWRPSAQRVPTRPSSSCGSSSGVPFRRGTPPPRGPVLGRSKEEIKRISRAILGDVHGCLSADPTEEELREMKDLLYEHWNDVKRVRRHLNHRGNGYVPASVFCKAIAQELAFRRERDMRVLICVVLDCLVDGEGIEPHPLGQRGEGLVDLQRLWEVVQRRMSGVEWKKRFRAAGVMPIALQRHTTGVDLNTRTQYDGPPYAVSGDSDHMKSIVKEYYVDRCARMRDILQRHGSRERPGLLTRAEFRRAMFALERYGTNDRELNDIIDVMDKRNTGMVSITEFLDRFSLEYLKGRSMRLSVGKNNNDGTSNTLQWPASMQPDFHKKALMDALRNRQMRTRRVAGSRSASLRRKHGREVRAKADMHPFFDSRAHRIARHGVHEGHAAATPTADDSLAELNRQAGEADLQASAADHHTHQAGHGYLPRRSGSGGGPRPPPHVPSKAEVSARPIQWCYVCPNSRSLGNTELPQRAATPRPPQPPPAALPPRAATPGSETMHSSC